MAGGDAPSLEVRLQSALEHLYRLDGTPCVGAFCIGEELLAALGEAVADPVREALLVHEGEDSTDLALFISREVRAGASSFLEALEGGGDADLDAFCAALEGVSHFVYFTFAGDGRPVSRLELEIQAEIDKFLVLRGVIGLPGDQLVERLFDRFRLREDLGETCRERYVVANRAARRYARWADRAFGSGRGESALDDARRLYRMPMASKLAHIARAA